MDDILQCYRILDLQPGVSADRIRRSYIELTHVWDPVRYMANPVLCARAEQKRKEIDAAYLAIRAFLPELQGPPQAGVKEKPPARDFKELSTDMPVESTRAVMGLLAGVVLLLLFAWAFYLVKQARTIYPAAAAAPAPVE